MELPQVNIAQAGTHVLRVRELPTTLKGIFTYDLSIMVPYEEGFYDSSMRARHEKISDKIVPWHDAKICIVFRKLDGTDVFNREFLLGTTPHGYSYGGEGWKVGWNLGGGRYQWDPVPVTNDSFDIVVTVERPSRRASDRISISAYASYPPMPKL
jgi:hypothetical protein